ncbi:hypothetical protein P5V15_013911 [Pogonomyrmex californicus]
MFRKRLGLIASIDNDPWGRPYRIVFNKLRSRESAAPIDYLTFDKIDDIVRLLFLLRNSNFLLRSIIVNPNDIPNVGEDEILTAIRKSCSRKAAPGLDDFSALILHKVSAITQRVFAKCFSNCLRDGVFPTV